MRRTLPLAPSFLTLAFAALAACGGDDLVLPHDATPAAIEARGGDGQTGAVASALGAPVVVRVLDGAGQPMAGVSVGFAVATGGSISPATAVTDDAGEASMQWTLGQQAGAQAVEARVVGAEQVTLRLSATAVASAAAAMSAVSGDGQSAVVGTALPESLVVQVSDAFGNPVAGTMVTWSADPGSVTPSEVTTGADGRAAAYRILGAAAGTQRASASASALSGAPVVFTSSATPGSAASLVMVSGDRQSGAPGGELADPLVVRLVDQEGNPVEHGAVTWVIGSGGGSVSPTTNETDAAGEASARWTLGSEESNTLNAVVSGVGIVSFTAKAVTGGGGGGGGESGDHLVFQMQPTDTRAKERISPPVAVALVDRNGAPVLLEKVKIRLELVEGSGKLGGKLERETQNGVAVFDDLKIDRAGEGKILRASAREHPELGTVDSRAFRIEGKED